MSDRTLLMGAVAYAPKVVTIWEGFKAFFAEHGLAFDYVLYSNYESQVEAQFDGTLPAGSTRILDRTQPYDHCNFTTSPGAPEVLIERFTELLFAMRWDDPQVRPLLELEGLREWRVGRTSGYAQLARAVDDEAFYSHDGRILATDYRY